MEFVQDIFVLAGRVLIGGAFLLGAYSKIKHWHASLSHLRTKHVPKANIVLPISVGASILGGLSIFLGWHIHLGAFLLLIVTVPSVLMFHPFWKVPAEERNLERALFLKEVAIIGGLLLLLSLGAGHFAFGG